MSKILKLVLGGVVVAILLATVGTYVYINYIREEAPDRLTLESAPAEPGAVAGSAEPAGASPSSAAVQTWKPTSDSQVGYRVDEVLFGQNVTAVGRTNQVTGSLTYDNTQVKTVDLIVDMASVKSDQSRRDGQFTGRIMSTSQYPTATFKLTQPIALPGELSSSAVTVKATGDLTLRGVRRTVTLDLTAKKTGNKVEVNGNIPIVFSDYEIPSPSVPGITTKDEGELEILVVFEPS